MSNETTSRRRTGRPALAPEDRRSERVSFGVTKRQKAAFLVSAAQAGLPSNDYARRVLCDDGPRDGAANARVPDFELVDALARIGADLERLRHIAEETGVVPEEIDAVAQRLNRKLDHLIVGSRIANELVDHRERLHEIAEKLGRKNGMTPKARRMITTFDSIVTKVLSA